MKLSSRLKLLVLIAFCVAPMGIVIYAGLTAAPRPKASAGELIQPPMARPELKEEAVFGSANAFSALQGRWLLVSVAGGRCDEACGRRLFIQRQLWTLMDKERSRLQTVWIINDREPMNPALEDKLKDEVVLRVQDQRLANWLQAAPGKSLAQSFYLVDPQGQWMMRFPADASLAVEETIKKDLERLLKASATWGP